MNKRFRSDVEKNLFRIPIILDKDTYNWFHNLSISMKISGGYKLPKSYIIRSLVNTVMRLNVNLKNIKTEADLEKRVLQSLINSRRSYRSKQDLPNKNQNNNLIVNVRMNRKQIIFLDKIAREMRFSGGKKPSRSSILNTFIKIAILLKPDMSGIRSERGSEERFFQAFRNTTKNKSKK